jgi:ATP-binding cassette, subfamily F, member 3
MISINNLSYYIGGRAIFENASLHVSPNDKIGLIGLNGSGKTTLLRLINGEYTPDSGQITKSNDCSVGFLNQDLLSYESDDSILSVAMQAFEKELAIQKKIDHILEEMEHNYTDILVEDLAHLQEQFESMDGYGLKAKAEEILEGIGFSTKDLERPLREFSGGWRMRVMLAKLLLEQPSLLMLDEPTNHLDLPSIQWVENYINTYNGAVILVSHDKNFLNNSVSRIVEVFDEDLVSYEGNYDFYLAEKSLRDEIQQNAWENQKQKIKQAEQFINRFRAKSTKARQVQSRIKSLERMDKVSEVVNNSPLVNIAFNVTRQPGKNIVDIKNMSKAYGQLEIFKNTSARIDRGDKIALIGANGKGKSTLLRIISGHEQVKGEVVEGYNVIKGFYAQHQLEALNIGNEILEELKQSGSGKTEQELRSVLGCFLFSGDDVFKKIKTLSGGEKSRVALAKTLISEANFLILDEPTNHLDMQSVNILIQALQQYAGSFIIVSHDRYFISETANKIWYIEGKEIKEYPGGYEDYAYWKKKQDNGKAHSLVQETKKQPREKKPVEDGRVIELKKQKKKLEKELNETETEIFGIEQLKKEIENKLSEPTFYENPEQLGQLNHEYQETNQKLDQYHQIWENLAAQLEDIEQELA